MIMRVSRMAGVAVATVFLGTMAGPALATPPLLAQAKQKGYPAQNCQYCHVSKMPKKDTFTPDDLNDRGKFLMAEQAKTKASAVDIDALKAYPGGKEQK